MKLVTTFHPPTSVSSSLKCTLTPDPDLFHLVVAKSSKIEVFSLGPDGLRQDCDLDIWGRVLAIRAIPTQQDSKQCNLLVMIDHPEPRVVLLSLVNENGTSRLNDVGSVPLFDRSARHAEFCNDLIVDHAGQVAVVSCYVGKLKIVTFVKGLIEGHFDVILPELNLLSLCFLHTKRHPLTLAIIYADFQQRIQLISRDLHLTSQELAPETSQVLPSTVLSPSVFPFMDSPPVLIPIPSFPLPQSNDVGKEGGDFPGGVLIVGGRKIYLYELASDDDKALRKGKQKRLERRKASLRESDVEKAKEKAAEREARKLKPKCHVRWPWSEITCWCYVDDDSRRFLLGDNFGRMSMLAVDDSPKLVVLPLGNISPPTTLTYLTNQIVYVGSHLGPAQLLRIHREIIGDPESDTLPIPSEIPTAGPSSLSAGDRQETDLQIGGRKLNGVIIRGKGKHLEVLDTHRNIAPIVDAVLVDTDGSGQVQLVTCSGGANTGSLNIIRTGAEIEELAAVDGVSCVSAMFPIRSHFESSVHTHLLVSTFYESYVLRLDGPGVFTRLEEPSPFATNGPTLALSNIVRRVVSNTGRRTTSSYVDSALVVQVIAGGINLLEYDESVGVFHTVGDGWRPDPSDPSWKGREVVAASATPSQFVLAFSGGRLALFNMADDRKVKLVKFTDYIDTSRNPMEVCALSCAPFDPAKPFASHIAISFWSFNTIKILSLEKAGRYMEVVCESTELSSLPRSLLLHNFGVGRKAGDEDYHPHILAGLMDGSVVSFTLKGDQLLEKRVFSLGSSPVSLSTCRVGERRAAFACGSRSAILYWDRQGLRQSAAMIKDVTGGVFVDTSAFPSVCALATSSGLVIGRLRRVDKMQVRNVPLGTENPTRIAFNTHSNTFGVASLHRVAHRVGDAENIRSSFSILDRNFSRCGQFMCEADEEISAVTSSTALPIHPRGQQMSCFVVGSVRHQLGEREPRIGRLMIFVSEDTPAMSGGYLHPQVATQTEGCVYSISVVDNFVVAAVNTAVVLYQVTSGDEEDSLALEKLYQWNHNYFVTSLIAHDGLIVIGDAISSISILEIRGSELKTVARDFGPLWPVAVEMTPGRGVIGANCDCNLFTFTLGGSSARALLERNGSYYTGEVVNKFLPGAINVQDVNNDNPFQPEHIYFTSSGRIGVVMQVTDNVALHLTALQRNMAKVIKGPGDISHTRFRAPANYRGKTDAEPAFGFLDGDFLESFLTEPHKAQILEGELDVERVTMDQLEVEALLERLQSLH